MQWMVCCEYMLHVVRWLPLEEWLPVAKILASWRDGWLPIANVIANEKDVCLWTMVASCKVGCL